MGWTQKDIADAFRFKSVETFRSSSKRKTYLEGLDALIARSFESGKVVPVERLKEMFDEVVRQVGEGEKSEQGGGEG